MHNTQTKPLPRIDGKLATQFKANGRTYKIIQTVPALRHAHFQKISLIVGYQADYKTQQLNFKKLLDMCNDVGQGQKRFIDMVKLISAMSDGISTSSQNKYAWEFYLCALFIVRENEDITKVDQDYFEEKIDDWNAEGYAVSDFLALARNSVKA